MKPLLLGLLMGLLALFGIDRCYAGKLGETKRELQIARQAVDSLTQEKKTVRLQLVRDTIHSVNTVRKYTEIRDTLRLTDTLAVAVALEAADSAIASLKQALFTANKALLAGDALEQGLRRENEALKRMVPGRTAKIVTAAKWLAVGVGVGAVLVR